MPSKFSHAISSVMGKARDGVKHSELSPAERAAAKQLLKQNKLDCTYLPNGDWLYNANR